MSHPNRRLIYQLNLAQHSVMKAMDNECRRVLGISSVQVSALLVLQEQPNCLMRELADTLLLDKSAVTGLVKRMSANNLVEKLPCSSDSRASRLLITDEGNAKLAVGVKLLKEAMEQLEQGFSEAELDVVSRFLTTVTETYRK